MALIKCPECETQISSFAETCPKCGFPVRDYIESNAYDQEVERLTSKILNIEYTYPSPRVKVCIKCGMPYKPNDDGDYVFQKCNCSFNGKQYPGVEVNYSNGGRDVGYLGEKLYIYNHCIRPMNIGDNESKEYQKAVSELFHQIESIETRRRNDGRRDWEIKECPPNPIDYTNPVTNFKKSTSNIPSKSRNTPRCPYCSSEKLKKISTTKKVAKISAFGIFGAGDLGKTWQCQNCGSKF